MKNIAWNIVDNEQVSMEALGMWLFLLSKKHQKQSFREADIRARFGVGKDKYQRVMRDLKEIGLVCTVLEHNSVGRIVNRTTMVRDIYANEARAKKILEEV